MHNKYTCRGRSDFKTDHYDEQQECLQLKGIGYNLAKCRNGAFGTVGLPGGRVVRNLPASAGDRKDMSSIPGLGRSPGGGDGNLLQRSCLENSMDRAAWQAKSMESRRVRHS